MTSSSASWPHIPQVRFFDAFVNDLNTIERGKRIDRANIARVFSRGMPLPGSMFALDIEGGTVEATGLGFDDGDADRPCLPIPGTLVPVPWQTRTSRRCSCTMYEHDGARFFGDPRHVLDARAATLRRRAASRRWWRSNTSSTWSTAQRDADGQPQPPRGPLTGRREFRTQINSMTDLNEYSRVASRDRPRVPAAGRAGHLLAGRIRTGTVRSEPGARRRCAARLRRGAAFQAHRQERGARARLRSHLPAQALSRHGRQRPARAREPAGRGRAQHLRGRRCARQRAAAPRDRRHAGDARPTAWRCARRAPIPTGAFAAEAYVPLHADLVDQQSRLGDARAGVRRGQPAPRTPAGRRGCKSVPGGGLGAGGHAPRTHAASWSRRRCSPAMPTSSRASRCRSTGAKPSNDSRAARLARAATSATASSTCSPR